MESKFFSFLTCDSKLENKKSLRPFGRWKNMLFFRWYYPVLFVDMEIQFWRCLELLETLVINQMSLQINPIYVLDNLGCWNVRNLDVFSSLAVCQSSRIKSHRFLTLPKTKIPVAPENRWLGDYLHFGLKGLFSEAFALIVSGGGKVPLDSSYKSIHVFSFFSGSCGVPAIVMHTF